MKYIFLLLPILLFSCRSYHQTTYNTYDEVYDTYPTVISSEQVNTNFNVIDYNIWVPSYNRFWFYNNYSYINWPVYSNNWYWNNTYYPLWYYNYNNYYLGPYNQYWYSNSWSNNYWYWNNNWNNHYTNNYFNNHNHRPITHGPRPHLNHRIYKPKETKPEPKQVEKPKPFVSSRPNYKPVRVEETRPNPNTQPPHDRPNRPDQRPVQRPNNTSPQKTQPQRQNIQPQKNIRPKK